MSSRSKTPLEQMGGSAYFDSFEPLRKIALTKEQLDKALGYDTMRQIGELTRSPIAEMARSVDSIVGPKMLSLVENSTIKQLGLAARKPLIEETIGKLGAGAGMIDAVNKADLYGGVRLDNMLGQIEGMRESMLIGSAVLPPDYLKSMGMVADLQPALDQLVGKLHFEPGRMLEQFKGLDTAALMLGREATLAAVRVPELDWDLDGLYTLPDLVSPVRGPDGELVAAAFPPDLIEEEPLSTEFEVDAIVAEHQTGAQVFLALRSPTAARRMEAARERLLEGDVEALAHSMTSCRRALHALADTVYPARSQMVKGRDGNERKVDDPSFKNRLLMFLADAIDGSTVLDLAEATLDKTVNHLDALIEQLSKGVHVDVVREEAKQAYVQTWAFIAHVAQVHSED